MTIPAPPPLTPADIAQKASIIASVPTATETEEQIKERYNYELGRYGSWAKLSPAELKKKAIDHVNDMLVADLEKEKIKQVKEQDTLDKQEADLLKAYNGPRGTAQHVIQRDTRRGRRI